MINYEEILSKKLVPIVDEKLARLQTDWYESRQTQYSPTQFINIADEWFKSTRRNTLSGWNTFDCLDIVMGCTHYIESIIIKYGWSGFQILPDDYAYYGLMGKFGVEQGQLEPNKPLLLSMPNWKYCDIRPEWEDLLRECEEKNIDIHIDMAWITTSKNISIDVGHPNIKSFAMSLSKYNMQWNRVGLRWSKQRTMDAITMFNHYYGNVNNGAISCGVYAIKNIPRDYTWNTYEEKHKLICSTYNLEETKFVHVGKKPNNDTPYGIAHLILQS